MSGDLHSKTGKSSDVEKIPLIFGSGRSVYKMDRYVNTLLLQAAADGVQQSYQQYPMHIYKWILGMLLAMYIIPTL